MKKFLFIIFTILLLTSGFATIAQGIESINLSGKIIDAETKAPVPYVHVVNKTSGKGTVSNSNGQFIISMTSADTLLFSAIGFERYAFSLDKKIDKNNLSVVIQLNSSTMELQPVNIFAYKDESSLKRALIEMDVPLESNHQFNSGWTPTKKHVPGGGVAVGGPISALYNTFSKEGRERRKLEKYEQDYNVQKNLRVKYNERLVEELTGLPENEVVKFMNFCKLEESFIRRASAYDIAVAVNHCLTEFIQVDTLPSKN